MDKLILYAFLYNSNINESGWSMISIHKTRKGAEMALSFHKKDAYYYWSEWANTPERQKEFPFGEHQDWVIEEVLVEE
jgi:hypothetical protein